MEKQLGSTFVVLENWRQWSAPWLQAVTIIFMDVGRLLAGECNLVNHGGNLAGRNLVQLTNNGLGARLAVRNALAVEVSSSGGNVRVFPSRRCAD
jgi:hypothetical protein